MVHENKIDLSEEEKKEFQFTSVNTDFDNKEDKGKNNKN